MKVAIPATGPKLTDAVDPRFGRARWFLVAETDTGEVTAHDNTPNLEAAQGAGIQAAQRVVELGAEAVIASNTGPKAFRVLTAAKVRIFVGVSGTIAEAVAQFERGALNEAKRPNAEAHW